MVCRGLCKIDRTFTPILMINRNYQHQISVAMKNLFAFLIVLSYSVSCLSQKTDDSKLMYKVDGKEAAYPRLSADGQRILFQTNENGPWQLYILDIESGHSSPVMSDMYNNNFPDLSADNKWIAFTSDRDGNEEIYLMSVESGETKRITNDGGRDIHPYFSPDGKYLLFNSTRNNGSFDVYRYTIADATLERITDTPENETCARYSPDMSKIVLLQNSDAKDDIMLMDARTFKMKNLSATPQVRDGWPMFSHDNQWVYYSSFETGSACIYRIKPDGSKKTQLTFAAANEEDARVYVARGCGWFVYNKRVGNTIEIRSLHS